MNNIIAVERARVAEDDYFRRRDAEIVNRTQEAHRVRLEQAALAEALGAVDSEAVVLLHVQGVRQSTAAVVEWLPTVEVAWLDGADQAERHAVRVQFSAEDGTSEAGLALLDRWLTVCPPEDLFTAGRQALRSRLQALDADDRRAALARIVAICEAAGRAAGGYFGIGALSQNERRHIESIQRDLERPN